jgi:hypothetical protein
MTGETMTMSESIAAVRKHYPHARLTWRDKMWCVVVPKDNKKSAQGSIAHVPFDQCRVLSGFFVDLERPWLDVLDKIEKGVAT